MITVDMLMHTFRRNMRQATLIASDLDFAPLLHALVQEGMYVTLWYPPSATNKELQAAADSRRYLTAAGLQSALIDERRRPFLPVWTNHSIGYIAQPFLTSWPVANNEVLHLHGDGNSFLVNLVTAQGASRGYSAHHDRRRLLMLAEEKTGSVLPDGAYQG